jgi:hypothetical protein
MRLIGRRDFVRGFGLGAGAMLLTPFARFLVSEARGNDAKASRWILVHDQLGLGQEDTERWIPNGSDLTAAGAIPASFQPLEPWASEMLILDRFINPFNPGQHGNGWASLAVAGEKPESVPGGEQSENMFPDPVGITVDIFAGEHLSAGAPFRTIAASTDSGSRSVDGSNNPVPDFRNTHQAYDQIFGGFDPSASIEEIQARLDRRLSVLDVVTEDLGRMRSRLAGPEREKLDQFEESILSLEDQLRTLADLEGCTLPDYPPDDAAGVGPHNGPLPPGYWEAMASIQATALICRLTNVLVVRPSPGRRTYQAIFGHDEDKHNTSHYDDTPALTQVDQYNAGIVAKMLSMLEQVPEGSGTMLDRTLMTWMDKGGGRHHGGYRDHPVIMVGSMEGHFDTGRYVTYPRLEHAISDPFVSMLQALGIDVQTFGDPTECKGPLPGLT